MYQNDSTKKIIITLVCLFLAYWCYQLYVSGELLGKLLILPGLILGLTIHEFSHAKASDKFGDPTPENQGRLTLNPLAHLDPVGTIFLITAGFGWGKPVEINPSYYRNPAKESMLVALAGPVSNFILAFILLVANAIIEHFLPDGVLWISIVQVMVYLGASINLSLGVFNLLPFPPLDGSKIFGYFLKGKAKEVLWTLERYSWFILMFLFMTELPAKIIAPVINVIANGMQWLIDFIFSFI